MNKIFIIILSLLSSNLVFAYNTCPEAPPPIIMIRFIDSDPKIIQEKGYKEMTKEADIVYSNLHVLGRYTPNFKSNSANQVLYRATGGSVCAKVTQVEVNVIMEPEIFISKEIIDNQCLRDRVIRHEKLHHGFALAAGNKMSVYGYNLAKKLTQRDFIGYSKQDVDLQIDKEKNLMVAKIKEFLINEKELQDKTIDNDENYKNEAKICPTFKRS